MLPCLFGRSARSGSGSSDSRWCSLIAPRIHGAIPAITGGCDARFRGLSFSPLCECSALASLAWRKTGASKSGRSSVLAVVAQASNPTSASFASMGSHIDEVGPKPPTLQGDRRPDTLRRQVDVARTPRPCRKVAAERSECRARAPLLHLGFSARSASTTVRRGRRGGWRKSEVWRFSENEVQRPEFRRRPAPRLGSACRRRRSGEIRCRPPRFRVPAGQTGAWSVARIRPADLAPEGTSRLPFT